MNEAFIRYEDLPEWARLLLDKAEIPENFDPRDLDEDQDKVIVLVRDMLEAERAGKIQAVIQDGGVLFKPTRAPK